MTQNLRSDLIVAARASSVTKNRIVTALAVLGLTTFEAGLRSADG